jgi:ribosomal protein S18 acetylase RimI-like enzyme
LLPEEIISLGIFPNKANDRVLELADKLSFNRHSDQTILSFHRSRLQELEEDQLHELEEGYFPEMVQLHDQAFPGTYYSGEQIINRLNEERKVFIVVTEGRLSGYIHVEAEPEFGEGSIEFFAVQESERGKGIGEKLLSDALNWFFTFESIQSIALSVSSGNRYAIRLKKKSALSRFMNYAILQRKYKKAWSSPFQPHTPSFCQANYLTAPCGKTA